MPAIYHGDDYMDGGEGADQLFGQGGRDTMFGGADDDTLVGDDTSTNLAGQYHGDDYLDGEGGNDGLQGQGGADQIFGGDGNDRLFGDDLTTRLAGQYHGDDYLDGEVGDDYLDGQGGDDTLFGGDGVDLLWGDGSGQDVAVAVHGNDYLDGGAAIDFLRGGGGADMLFGGTEDDVLIGDDLESVVAASAHGSDTLDGEEGNDKLWGNGGADTLLGGDGDDTLMGDSIHSQLAAAAHGDDTLDGGVGADVLVGGGGNDTLLGGDGDDRMNGDDSGDNLDISANGNDYMDGGAGSDVLIGAGGADTLLGGDGNDALHGGDGADVLDGGSGADYLAGGQGDDLYFAGAGDLVRDTEGASPIVLDANFDASNLQVAVDSNSPEHSVLTITSGGQSVRIDAALSGPAMSFEFADGSVLSLEQLLQRAAGIHYSAGDGADRVLGTGGADELRGLSGDDLLFGQDGDDRLLGGNGADVIEGGAGNDVLNGGSGNDRLIGGTGADRYTLDLGAGYDEIVDDGGELSFGGSVRTSDVRLVTQGDDLRVDLSPRDQITIRGYAQSAANWSVRFSDGTAVALSALPTVPSPSLPTDAVAAKAAFIDDLRRWWYAEQLKAGMEPRGDGTLSAVSVSESLYGKETTYLSSAFSVNSRTVNQPVLASLEMSTTTTSQVLSSQSEPRLVPVPVVVYSQPSFEPIYGPNRNPLTGQPEIIGYHYFPSQTIVEYRLQEINYVTTVRQTSRTYNVDDLTTGVEDNIVTISGGGLVSTSGGNDVIASGGERYWNYDGVGPKPFFVDAGEGNDRITTGAGDDWLIGGAGDDLLQGGFGSDRYLRFSGHGRDLIIDHERPPIVAYFGSDGVSWPVMTETEYQAKLTEASTDADVLVLPTGVSVGDLSFEWLTRTVRAAVGDVDVRRTVFFNETNIDPTSVAAQATFDVELPVLLIRWGSGEEVVLAMPTPNMPRGFGIERVELSDGTVLTRDDLYVLASPGDLDSMSRNNVLENVSRGYGGAGDDTVSGTSSADLLLGGAGSDHLIGGDGDDELIGGKGADVLDGGAGSDVLGNDRYSVGNGADPVEIYSSGNTYIGGTGNDEIYGTRDADTYVFNIGDGVDVVYHESPWRTGQYLEQGYSDRLEWWDDTDITYWDYAFNELSAEQRSALTRVDEYGNPIEPDGLVPIKALDTLRFGTGVAPSDVQVARAGNDLVFALANGQDSVVFRDWFAPEQRWDSATSQWIDIGQKPQALGRVEFADGTVWQVTISGAIEVTIPAVTLDGTEGADQIYATDGTPAIINGGAGNDLLVGADQADTINAGADDDTVYGNAGNDVLDGGDGDDTVYGWDGDDTLQGGNGVDHLYGDAGNDVVDGGAGDDTLFGWTGDDQLRGGEGNDVIGGDDGNDLVDGGAGSDALFGWTGTDVVQGGAGWDYVDGGGDNDALTGGTEGDTLIGGGGGDFLAGGSGNDGLRPGAGADIVAFNRGDGADTVYAPTVGEGAGERNDTLSLGGIRYSELRLAREGDDLLLKVDGATDAVRFEGWYVDPNNDAVSTLQLIVDSTADYDAANTDPLVNRRIARLNFQTLVGAFDAAYNANPSIGDWAIPSATLSTALVASSDTDAIGGQLAYRYGRDGNLAGLDFATASAVLADASFGTAAQSIGSGPTSGGVRLMRVSATAPETGELDARVSTGTPLLSRTAPLADDAAAASKLPSVQGEAADAERVGLPRRLGRWLGEVANADSGFWLKRPFGAKLVAADTQPAPAIAICELAQPEADARVAGAPHSATGGTLDGSTPSLPAATDHTAPRLASKLRPLTAAMVDAAISGALRSGATDRWPSINADPVELTAIAHEGQPEGSSLADLPRASARFASTDASVSARWQRVEAYLRAEQSVGIAPTLGGEDLVDTGSLRQIGLGGAALAIDESQRSMRAVRRTMVA
ncbi:MAG: hypothetical protein AMXMBFR25_30800 [Lysobacterales bacterium]